MTTSILYYIYDISSKWVLQVMDQTKFILAHKSTANILENLTLKVEMEYFAVKLI